MHVLNNMRPVDKQLYRIYEREGFRHEFQRKFRQWYENGGIRQESEDLQRARRIAEGLVKKMNIPRAAKALRVSPDTVINLITGCAVSKKTAQKVVRNAIKTTLQGVEEE